MFRANDPARDACFVRRVHIVKLCNIAKATYNYVDALDALSDSPQTAELQYIAELMKDRLLEAMK